MPHITLECSYNVTLDYQSFFKELSVALVETGHASQIGIKARVVRCHDHYIADGSSDNQMINLLFRMREGRPPEVLAKFSEIGMDLLKAYCKDSVNKKKIILSTEIKELIKGQDLTFNSMR